MAIVIARESLKCSRPIGPDASVSSTSSSRQGCSFHRINCFNSGSFKVFKKKSNREENEYCTHCTHFFTAAYILKHN